jgi:cob(I)alamin adenosyltransferase
MLSVCDTTASTRFTSSAGFPTIAPGRRACGRANRGNSGIRNLVHAWIRPQSNISYRQQGIKPDIMGNRLSRVVTRTGDKGSTGMADGSRRAKHDARVHCLGEIDELNAHIGVCLSLLDDGPAQQLLFAIQHDLFDIGAELCQPGKQLIGEDYVDALESSIEELNAGLPALKEFILPGGTIVVASIQLARSVCRRVERGLVELSAREDVNPVTCRYLNRLSDLLFILGRSQAQQDGSGEVYWNSRYSRLQRDK